MTGIAFAQTDSRPKLDARLLNIDASRALMLQRGTSRVLVPFERQASASKAEDGPPSGPDSEVSPTYLVDKFEAMSSEIDDDFDRYIPYSDELIRDHTSLNTYYFYPGGYLLKRDATDGYEIDFLHRTRDDDSADELILLTFTLAPRHLDGAVPLLETLADYAIEPLNDKEVDLNRFPISSVKVNLGGLSSIIPEENIRVINQPRRVGDNIRVQATMDQSQKEEVVASIRDYGLSGDIEFLTNDDSFMLIVPYFVSFTDYAGEWLTDITRLTTSDSVSNVSPFPVRLNGIAAYVKPRTGGSIKRYYVPLAEPAILSPGAVASADRAYDELFENYGQPISTWPVYDRLECEDCLNAIEREILVSPAMASRTDLPIEAIPMVFDRFSLFKVLVEVRSRYFSASGDAMETRNFTLRPEETMLATQLFVDREADGAVFEYRITPFHNEGVETRTSEWLSTDGLMDITIHPGLIGPLVPAAD
jgi:hypothetical protein